MTQNCVLISIVFILPSDVTGAKDDEAIGKSSKWVKTGIEFYDNKPLVSTVTRDTWADWSLYPSGITINSSTGEASVTLLIERQDKDDTFWVYVIGEEGKKPIREVTWVLSDVEGKGGDREVWVGVYSATPKVSALLVVEKGGEKGKRGDG
jgi:regulation of enolase protein 1 (concanavalin A-like superfamily)